MASIQTAIELQDHFSRVLYGIIDSVNIAVNSMADMQASMSADVDTSGFDSAREAIAQATAELERYNGAMDQQSALDTGKRVRTIIQEPESVKWQSEPIDIFVTNGYDRFVQEVQSADAMLDQLSSTQNSIAKQAYNTNIFPPEAFQNLNTMAVRIDMIRERIRQIENNRVNMGTDTANAELEQLRAQLASAVISQNELNAAMKDMDVSAANEAYIQLAQTIGNTERYIRDNVDEQGAFNQLIRDGTQDADGLMNTIKGAVAAYVSMQSVRKVINLSDSLVQTTSRLNMMNDGLQTTDELVNMTYAAAQDARGAFSDMADVVARFGNNAGSAFGSTTEVVAFANLIQKQMTIAGASTQEASNAMLQLSQALGSGVLRGDELNSIFEQAPNLIQSIASYIQNNESVARQMAETIGVSYEEMSTNAMGHIRDVAAEGLISADIVKAAIFSASDEINANFESMPMTWGQAWTKMQNTAMMAFRTVLQRINDTANSDGVESITDKVVEALQVLANVAVNTFDLMASGAELVADNWSVISPIVYGVVGALAIYAAYLGIVKAAEVAGGAAKAAMCIASYAHAAATGVEASATAQATAAQLGLNTALLSCPLTWILVSVILIVAVIYAICTAIAKLTGVASSGFGVITGSINVTLQFFKNLGLGIANIALAIGNVIAALGGNIKTSFFNAISNVQAWFYGLLSDVLNVIEGICAALNKLPFVSFDYSGITSSADDYAAKAAEASGNKESYTSISDAFKEGISTFDTFQDGWVSDAFSAGAAWGDGIAEKVESFSLSDIFGKVDIPDENQYTDSFADAISNGIGDGIYSIADDTGDIKDSLDITQEDLKYLRDIAEQEAVNRFTTAEIHVDMSGMQNTVNNGGDIDGFMTQLTDAVNEAVDIMAEGVHE